MKRTPRLGFSIALLVAISAASPADDQPSDGREKIIAAIERGVAIIEAGARNYPTHRKCFACHHQTLPLLGVGEAREAGAKTDDKLPAAIVEFADASFRGKLDDLRAGENIGGKGLTVGYGLWTLRLAKAKPDDLTDAMVTYLLQTQEEDGHWALHSIRPPAEESLVLCTVMAASGIVQYAAEAQRDKASAAVEKARRWLAVARLESQEDKVARLWGLRFVGQVSNLPGAVPTDADDQQSVAAARASVLEKQRDDGGWGQTDDMESDAYSTGTTLFVLLDTGLPASDARVQRAVDYLARTQLADGSWHVKTRAKPVQVFFDNGDPHGKDQFISISATSWSVAALSRAIRQSAKPSSVR